MHNLEERLGSSSTVVLLDSYKAADTQSLQHKIRNGKLIVVERDGLQGITPSTVDVVLSYAPTHASDILMDIVSVLKPNGLLVIYEKLQGRSFAASEELSTNLMMTGFTDTAVSNKNDFIEVSSIKPDWELGSTQKIDKKRSATSNNGWSVSGPDTDLIDEDSLLDDVDRYSKPSVKRDDCEVGSKGKKACKNCTCGRAEAEAEGTRQKLTLDMLENPGANSSCGSCGLGDAFRCAGCPYRGLPSFKPGEKISIPASFLEDDI